jgi:hypothetical protein
VDSQDGTAVTVTNEEYNATVPTGGSTTFGMIVDATNQDRTEPELTCEGD